MSQANQALSPQASTSIDAAPDAPPQDAAWNDALRLLRRAAKLAGELDSDAFMQAAWQAYLDERPGLREALEDKELRVQLKKLRKKGLIGLA